MTTPIDELEALRDADFYGIPREALVVTIHVLAEEALERSENQHRDELEGETGG